MLAQRPGSPTRMVASPPRVELGGNSLAAAAAAATTGSLRTGLPTMQGLAPSAMLGSMQGMQGMQGMQAAQGVQGMAAPPQAYPAMMNGMQMGASAMNPQMRGVPYTPTGSASVPAGSAQAAQIGMQTMQGVPVQAVRPQSPQQPQVVTAQQPTPVAAYQQAPAAAAPKQVDGQRLHGQSSRKVISPESPRAKSPSSPRGRERRRGDNARGGSNSPSRSPGRITESKSRIFDDLYQDAQTRAKRQKEREAEKRAKQEADIERQQREHAAQMKKLKSGYLKQKEQKFEDGMTAHLGREAAFQLWREKRRQQRADWYERKNTFEEMAECTFTPAIYTSTEQRVIAETRLERIKSEREVLKLPPETPQALKSAACRLSADELEQAVPSRPTSPGRIGDGQASTATLNEFASSEVGGASTPIPESSLPPGVFDHSGKFPEPLQMLLDAKLQGSASMNGVSGLPGSSRPETPSGLSRAESAHMTPIGGMTPRGGTTPRSRTASAAALGSAVVMNDSLLSRHQAALLQSGKGSLSIPLGGSSIASPTASVSQLVPAASVGSGVVIGTPRSGASHPATPRSNANSVARTAAQVQAAPTMADQVQKSTDPDEKKGQDDKRATGVLDNPASQEGFLQALQAVQELRERNVLLNEQNAELAEALDERERLLTPGGLPVENSAVPRGAYLEVATAVPSGGPPMFPSTQTSSTAATPRQAPKAPYAAPGSPQQMTQAVPMATPVASMGPAAMAVASAGPAAMAYRPSPTGSMASMVGSPTQSMTMAGTPAALAASPMPVVSPRIAGSVGPQMFHARGGIP